MTISTESPAWTGGASSAFLNALGKKHQALINGAPGRLDTLGFRKRPGRSAQYRRRMKNLSTATDTTNRLTGGTLISDDRWGKIRRDNPRRR